MDNLEKYKFIFTEGEYIGVRFYYNYAINLYLCNDTFYEAFYFIPTNKIKKIEILNDEKKLDLYIKHMNDLDLNNEK